MCTLYTTYLLVIGTNERGERGLQYGVVFFAHARRQPAGRGREGEREEKGGGEGRGREGSEGGGRGGRGGRGRGRRGKEGREGKKEVKSSVGNKKIVYYNTHVTHNITRIYPTHLSRVIMSVVAHAS